MIAGFVLSIVASFVPFLVPAERFKKPIMRWILAVSIFFVASAVLYSVMVEKPERVIAGRVVDQTSGDSVPGATLSVTGTAKAGVSESNGNFTLRLGSEALPEKPVRLHVEKYGYAPYDQSVAPGEHELIVPLRRLGK